MTIDPLPPQVRYTAGCHDVKGFADKIKRQMDVRIITVNTEEISERRLEKLDKLCDGMREFYVWLEMGGDL